ncbi:uncharacterized protein LOC115879485 [Sitophilus oryzae]|uniref:Uncharacterized protein LOC115879485 n=1 Tax=Sitophilus oryzae TaxID=7048 RepID=A0A6J2XN18_SITOR|nr:uncharacterized protein LOC115879485 [Sitophilus oryzae]
MECQVHVCEEDQKRKLNLGDFSAKVGKGKSEDVVGDYGTGERNERGDTLIQFCQEENFFICNTWFELPARRLYTWKSPQDSKQNPIRNQIDYILAPKRYRNGVLSAKTYPGADVGSDHNPVVARIRMRLKKFVRKFTKKPNMSLLRSEAQQQDVSNKLNEQLGKIQQPNASQTPGLEDHNNIENIWKKIKEALQETQEQLTTNNNEKHNKAWMTQEILVLMEKRRSFKGTDPQRYRDTHRLIRNKIKEAKELWMTERCREVEELHQKHDLFNLHKKVKEVTGKHKPRTCTRIVDGENKPILTEQKLEEVWTNYIRELFDGGGPSFHSQIETENGPDIMISEIERALKNTKNRKAPGPDNIYPELIKLINGDNLKLLKCRDQRKEVHLCFIDYTKAFDCVNHRELLSILERRGLDTQDLKIIQKLYEQQVATVKLQDTETTAIPIKRGVRQGLSPMLFNMYSELIFRNALEGSEDGIKVNGRLINNMRYADDTVVIADTTEGLQRLLDRLFSVGDSMGLRINLRINTNKTKVMVINRDRTRTEDSST